MGRRVLAGALLASLALLPSCGDDTVRLSFVPAAGERAEYRIRVRAEAVTTVGDEPSRRTVDDTELVASHEVLEAGEGGSRVSVRLAEEGKVPSVFVVRFDGRGRPVEVQQTEGRAAGVADLGLSELFPGAAGVPPERRLAPGDRWAIDAPVALAGPAEARLSGEGRLVALEAAGGRRLARVESGWRLPVRRTAEQTGGRLVLDGSLDTNARVAYDLDDDVVHSVRARTTGRYRVTLLPPDGVGGAPVPGTLVVHVDSTTRRVG